MRWVDSSRSRGLDAALHPLLNHLSIMECDQTMEIGGWRVTPVSGGANNLLYRIGNEQGKFAVKFTLRDARRRAARECLALRTLRQRGLAIAPIPLLLDEERYAQPVTVSTWLDGPVSDALPATDAEWCKLLEHYAVLHTILQNEAAAVQWPAVLSADSVAQCQHIVQQQVAHIPPSHRPVELKACLRRFQAMSMPHWSPAAPALCRTDANLRNFIRCATAWASVDWENSGWGDAAFEVAEIMAHPAYLGVPESRWNWVIETYCGLVDAPALAVQIRVYYKTMLVWWVARLSRTLYEVPLGKDDRLIDRPADWQEDVLYKFYLYCERVAEVV